MNEKNFNGEIHRKRASEHIESVVCIDNGHSYRITKPFRVTNGKRKIYPISQTAAGLNNLRYHKRIFWTISALLPLSLGVLLSALLSGLL